MRVEIPVAEVAWFRDVLGTEAYLREERNYKLALHRAISALLAPELLADSRFPTLLSAILGEDDASIWQCAHWRHNANGSDELSGDDSQGVR